MRPVPHALKGIKPVTRTASPRTEGVARVWCLCALGTCERALSLRAADRFVAWSVWCTGHDVA
jgi:hypothetical protein